MTKVSKPISLRKKLAFIYLASIATLLGIVTTIFFVTEVSLIRSDYQERIFNQGQVLTQSLLPAIMFEDKEEVARQLQSISKTKEHKSMVILGKNGQKLGSFGPPVEVEKIEMLKNIKANNIFGLFNLSYLFEVKQGDNYYGSIIVDSVPKRLKSFYFNQLVLLFFIAIVSIFMVWAFTLKIQRLFSEPILYILDVMEVVNEYEDYDVRTLDHPDRLSEVFEFHNLARVFDKLLGTVNTKNKEIQDYALNLELKVQEKTDQVKQLEASNIESSKLSALGEMAAGIAHEINNPLQIISGNTWFLKKNLNKIETLDNEKKLLLDKKIENINRTVERVSEIIQALKNFSRDGLVDEIEELEVNDLIEGTLVFCRSRFVEKGVKLEFNSGEQKIYIDGQRTLLGQVLLNILNNSIDAIEGTQDAWTRVELRALNDVVDIIITDSGNGIPESSRDKIMQPFYTTKEMGKGTGIGLSISHGIMEKHGGQLFLDDKCPNTRFVMRLTRRLARVA